MKVFSFSDGVGEYSGGAHGGSYYEGMTFDLSTGKELKLSDFLNSGYESFLMAYVEDQIQGKTNNCASCGGLDPSAEGKDWRSRSKVDVFALSQDGLTLFFGDYDLGPYVDSAGGQKIFVSKSVLKDFIKRDW